MSEEEKGTERLTSGMSLSNLADRLNAVMMTGPSIPLPIESKLPVSTGSSDKPPKE